MDFVKRSMASRVSCPSRRSVSLEDDEGLGNVFFGCFICYCFFFWGGGEMWRFWWVLMGFGGFCCCVE